MSTPAHEMTNQSLPEFTQGIKYFAKGDTELNQNGKAAVIGEGQTAIATINDDAVYQTLLAADASERSMASSAVLKRRMMKAVCTSM